MKGKPVSLLLNRWIQGSLLLLLLASGAYAWHRSVVNKAKAEAAASARTEGYNEYRDTIYTPEKQRMVERIAELETTLVEVAKQKTRTIERITVIGNEATREREAVDRISDGDLALIDVRKRLGAITASLNNR